MKRRDFMTLLGGATAAWPLVARAQQQTMSLVGILNSAGDRWVAAFRKGLSEEGQVEGRNAAIELRSTAQYGEVPSLAAELVQLPVDLIVAQGAAAFEVHKLALPIPVVFSMSADLVSAGSTICTISSDSRTGFLLHRARGSARSGWHPPILARHMKKPDLFCVRPVERTNRLGGGLQQNLAALLGEISLSLRR